MGTKLKLPNVRIFFPRVFKAEDYENDGRFAYSAKFAIVPGSTNDTLIREAIAAEAAMAWPKPGKAELKLLELSADKRAYCYRDGKFAEYDGAEGVWVLTAKRQLKDGKPSVVDRDKTRLTEEDGKPYGGCFVTAHVEIWAQAKGNEGLRCSLRGVQFYADGPAFGGASRATDDEFEVFEPEDADDLM